jgi:hypothetical protein
MTMRRTCRNNLAACLAKDGESDGDDLKEVRRELARLMEIIDSRVLSKLPPDS